MELFNLIFFNLGRANRECRRASYSRLGDVVNEVDENLDRDIELEDSARIKSLSNIETDETMINYL